MRVLMFGWEFPPHISGGLGTACYGITRGLARQGVEVVFVLPKLKGESQGMDAHLSQLLSASGVRIHGAQSHVLNTSTHEMWENQITFRSVDSPLFAYDTQLRYSERHKLMRGNNTTTSSHSLYDPWDYTIELSGSYGPDLISEVYRYSQAAGKMAMEESFDVIHAHDWMTYPAGIMARHLSGKPLVVHLHATEYDRSGENINPVVAAIEQAGLLAADKVIAVSHLTRQIAINRYGVNPDKVGVVHNAVSRRDISHKYTAPDLCSSEKRVLFMGRVTFQKGPEYFVEAAHMVLKKMPNVRFIMAGSGDLLYRMVRRVSQLRIGNRFHFPGFMRGADVDRMYALSDLYVMPSVSEPFGIAPLEAMLYDVPVLMSKQSGVAEILDNALKVDFWDTTEMANKICAVLTYPYLASEIVKNCREELKSITWDRAALGMIEVYKSALFPQPAKLFS